MNANMWFKNMDKLRHYFNNVNASLGLNILYSTPSCYLKAVHNAAAAAGRPWPTKTDDFFPYASDPHAYWTGYFTSRPALKGMIRQANSLLQAAKQIHSRMPAGKGDDLMQMARRAVAVNQHHDAVTGTAKQHVTDDYALRLHNGMEASRAVMVEGLKLQIPSSCDFSTHCPLLNISQCTFTESRERFSVLVYNPQARTISAFVRVPVESNSIYSVRDSDGTAVLSQLVPLPLEVLKIPGRSSTARLEVVFEAADLPGLGSRAFSVEKGRGLGPVTSPTKVGSGVVLENEAGVRVELTSAGGIQRISSGGKDIHAQQQFAYYEGAVGDNMEYDHRASGAYIFRPTHQDAIAIGEPQTAHFVKGALVQEVHQRFNSWLSQVLRLYKDSTHLELEWIVGPLPLRAHGVPGVEVISR
jgi:lysosomal alpha-mannosidase